MRFSVGRFLRNIGVKSASADYPGTWVNVTGGSDGINQNNLLDANREWVFIAVDKVASAVAAIRFKVMRYSRNGDDQEVFEGPLADFLEAPSPQFTGKDFIYLNTVYKELTGNAFWERVKQGAVQPLVPTRVSPVLKGSEVLGYRYQDGMEQRVILAKNVLHDRYIDPAKPNWGKGKLQRIARWVDTSAFVTEFLSRFFTNGATFGGFITTEEESEERIKLIKLGLANDHVGIENAHKMAVLPKGSDYKQTTSKMSDMEMGATDDRYRDKILAGFGVPKTLVGLTTEVNRASAEASEYIFAKYTVKPIADDLVEFLNTNVAPTYDSTGQYYFAYDEFVPVDREIQLKERESALGKQPYQTVNEVRASVGLPPVANGDIIYANPMLLPLGEPPPVPTPAPALEDDDKPKKAMPRRARQGVSREKLIDELARSVREIATAHEDPDAVSHKSFVARVAEHDKLIADKVREFNNRQERDVAQDLKHIVKAVKKGDLYDMEREVGAFVDFIGPMLKGLMIEQAVAEFIDQGFEGAFDENATNLRRIVEFAAKRVARSYNSTTAELLSNTLNEGISEGEDLTQLTSRVRSIYEYSNSVRAEMVAHTEAFYIANEGSREAYRQSGVVKTMRWYTAEDERVCEFCGPQNGRTVGTNEVFYPKGEELVGADGGTLKLDYRAIDVPPLHTRCRCFIRPERIDIS